MLKEIPIFNTEDEARDFWAKQDSTEYLDWAEAEVVVFPQLKPTTRSISSCLLDELKELCK